MSGRNAIKSHQSPASPSHVGSRRPPTFASGAKTMTRKPQKKSQPRGSAAIGAEREKGG